MDLSLCRFGTLMAAFALLGAGCSSQAKPVKVEGVVTLDGKPLEGAIVTFLPEGGGGGRVANGKTDDEGSFLLSTSGLGAGVLPGDYKVTVTYIPPVPDEGGPADPAQEQGKSGPQLMAGMMKMAAAQAKAIEKSPVPAVYKNAAQTPLSQTVPPEGKVILALRSDLKPAPKVEPAEKASGGR